MKRTLLLAAAAVVASHGVALGIATSAYASSSTKEHNDEFERSVLLAIEQGSRLGIFSQSWKIRMETLQTPHGIAFVLRPLGEASGSTRGSKQDWRIEVDLFRRDKPDVKVTGRVPPQPTAGRAQRPSFGEVVVAATRHLNRQLTVTLPVIISVGKTSQGFEVFYDFLPARPGSHALVLLSPNLRLKQVVPGL
jgi:hypothetical protein